MQNKTINNHQYLYHNTHVYSLKSILEFGLKVANGKMSKAINDKKVKVFFSEGIEGAIAMAENFKRNFEYMKKGTEWEYKSLEDFLEERVFLRFWSDDIINENTGDFSFADGYTSQEIPPNKLKVCVLKNIQTGKISYQRDDILKYMLATHPFEKFKNGNDKHKSDIAKYYEERLEELSNFDSKIYILEDMDLDKFYEQYISNRLDIKPKEYAELLLSKQRTNV